ncbi:hypothetical protein [Marinobacterium mangrovicola]|uniref:Uncharacterized protein n=1 Tax=Marinobacterium mangrovicola TaxID=1476959 RepID=A0A4R1GAU6_9GAMM|nr:hypothetical protein [Marinobacterium mangrovicola]TCK03635.1 hypothetical protein CLV83_3909 [Marinobacterium mangrovicola]
MTVETVGTRWVANPGNNFQICIPEHWKASGYRENPGLLIVQSNDTSVTLTISAYARKPDMDVARFAEVRLSLVDDNLTPVSERSEQDGVIFQRFEGLAEGESVHAHYVIAITDIPGGYFSFSLVTDADNFDRNRTFFLQMLKTAQAA